MYKAYKSLVVKSLTVKDIGRANLASVLVAGSIISIAGAGASDILL